jgi:hypothetical protein
MVLFICVLRTVPSVCDFLPFSATVPADQFSSSHPCILLLVWCASCHLFSRQMISYNSPFFPPNTYGQDEGTLELVSKSKQLYKQLALQGKKGKNVWQ